MISKAFPAASTTGNLIIVHVDYDNQAISVNTLTDSKGNTYTRINGPTNWNGANYRAELWYAYNITGGAGAITVKAKLSGNPTSFSQIYISEYSGIATINPLDQSAVAIGNAAAVSSGNKTTTYTNELVYGASIGASGALTVGGGFTTRSAANQNIIEDKSVVAAGSYATQFTSAGGNWVAQMATFVSTSSVILPVDLISFTGNCNNNHIDLNWSTSSETNNNYFTVEQSEDGKAWTNLGTIPGAGNSTTVQNYSYTAKETAGTISYFRLKQTNLDGTYWYSEVLQVANCSPEQTTVGASIYPNPCNGRSLNGKISLKADESYSVGVYDNMGKMVALFSSAQTIFSFPFEHTLPSGIYYARFSAGNSSTTTTFLVRQ
jgi:hypothetical protein